MNILFIIFNEQLHIIANNTCNLPMPVLLKHHLLYFMKG